MKILQVLHSFFPHARGGVQTYTYWLAQELQKNHSVSVFCRGRGFWDKQFSAQDEAYRGLPIHRVYDNQRSQISLALKNKLLEDEFHRYIEEIKPDVVHFQHLAWLSPGLVEIVKKINIPGVLTLHDCWFLCPRIQLLRKDGSLCSGPNRGRECEACEDALPLEVTQRFTEDIGNVSLARHLKRFVPAFLKNMAKAYYASRCKSELYKTADFFKGRYESLQKISKSIDLFISPSIFLKELYTAQGFSPEGIVYMPHGLKLFLPHKSEGVAGVLRFAFIGGVERHKGTHVLLDAFNKISDPGVELYIYGKSDPKYRAFLARLKKNPNVYFKGDFNSQDIAHVLSKIDVLVIPSICSEAFSLVAHEAFISKIPVIASNIGALPEVVKHRENGLLFEPNDADDLHEKMMMLIDNKKLVQRLKEGIPEIKGIEEHAAELCSLYQALISRRKNASLCQ